MLAGFQRYVVAQNEAGLAGAAQNEAWILRIHLSVMLFEYWSKLGLQSSNTLAVTETSDSTPVSNKEFLDIQATTEYTISLKYICDMIRTNSQIHYTNKYS